MIIRKIIRTNSNSIRHLTSQHTFLFAAETTKLNYDLEHQTPLRKVLTANEKLMRIKC